MSDLTNLCYVSSATRSLSVAQLTDLLIDARQFNQSVQVTGVLLHHDGGFFQYLEGPPAAIALSLRNAEWSGMPASLKPADRRQPAGLALLQSFWATVPESRAHGY